MRAAAAAAPRCRSPRSRSFAVGIDIADRFAGTGTRLAAEKHIANAGFAQADGGRLPFRDAVFDLVFSHSVIEHVTEAEVYLAECRRVLRPGGSLYLSTAPYLSLAGSHFPRLVVPIPLHILLGRDARVPGYRFIARVAPFLLQEGKHGTSFIAMAAEGKSQAGRPAAARDRARARRLDRALRLPARARRPPRHRLLQALRARVRCAASSSARPGPRT